MPNLTTRNEIYTTSYQQDLKVKSKTPWAIGFGASRPFGKNKLHLSAEWYVGVPKYTLMAAANHVSQNPDSVIAFNLTDQIKGIVNFGIGMEVYLNEHISGFASFSTDYSTVSSDITRFVQRLPEASNSSWKADFYNLGGGIVLHLKGAHLTLGVTHTGARQTLPQLINFPGDSNSAGSIFDPNTTSEMKWDRWRFVFSFSFPFLADIQKKFDHGD